MSDIIKLLPDNVANQIAAGEVVQRPASAVKELLENAVDAGATKIDLIIKDAGKTLIQVVDNGCGMSETDARMCFERHATSKITQSEDLFSIRTKGFRGEALASIAAIAQVELQTKTHQADIGTKIVIEGSKIIAQEPVACPAGSNITVKNLFFNVPARRNFLKSNPVETKHIIDEFERVALVHHDIHFTMHHNGNEVFNLYPSNTRQRIIAIFGKRMNERLVPVEQETNVVNVFGYVVKPEFSKRTRGEQFFFVNKRFIKSSYLNHAIKTAYDNLIGKDQHPSYFIYLEVDPSFIDINIHPTKTEIKFEDERTIYAIVKSAVKNSLGKYNIAPSIDFDQSEAFEFIPKKADESIKVPTITIDTNYNPFKTTSSSSKTTNKDKAYMSNMPKSTGFEQEDIDANLNFLDQIDNSSEEVQDKHLFSSPEQTINNEETENKQKFYQLNRSYILTQTRSGLLIIDQQRAHERVLFDRYLSQLQQRNAEVQKLLFPEQIEFNSSDYSLILGILEELNKIGFDISEFGKNTLVINGVPSGVAYSSVQTMLEGVLDDLKHNSSNTGEEDLQQKIALSLARNSNIKSGRKMEPEEMEHLFNELFACSSPYFSPSGKPIIVKIDHQELNQRFEK